MKLPFKIITFVVSIVFLSCGQENKETPKENWENRYEKQNQLDTLNKKEAENLTRKLNAIQSQAYDLNFTYQIQEIIKDSSQLISITGHIKDIVQKDGNYFFKIFGVFSMKYCLFEIKVPSEMFHKIFNQLEHKYSLNMGCFIFKPTGVKSSSLLTIDSEVSDGETIDDAESSLTYEFNDEILFLKGNLIDYYVYKKLPKDED